MIIQGRHDRLGQKGVWPARSRTRRPEWQPRNQGDHCGHRQHRQHSGLTAGSLRLLPGKRQGLQQVEPGPGPCKPKDQFHTQLPLGLTQGTCPTRGGSIGSIGGGGGYLHHPGGEDHLHLPRGGEGGHLPEKGEGRHPHLRGRRRRRLPTPSRRRGSHTPPERRRRTSPGKGRRRTPTPSRRSESPTLFSSEYLLKLKDSIDRIVEKGTDELSKSSLH